MTMLINKENLLRQLDDRPLDGWISVQAVRAMIEQEEEKTGKWIPHLFPEADAEFYECSECHLTVFGNYIRYKHCPGCGARMVKE